MLPLLLDEASEKRVYSSGAVEKRSGKRRVLKRLESKGKPTKSLKTQHTLFFQVIPAEYVLINIL